LFDRSTVGLATVPADVEIERARVRAFAKVLGETDPIHFDVEAARSRGFADLVAPPSYFVVLDALADEMLARRGQPSAAELIRCDFRYLLHGEERYRYYGVICAGDTVTLTTVISGFDEKKAGLLEFARLTSEASHAARGTLIVRERTLIHQLPHRE
jgi:acyl dehydratase